MVSKPGFLPDQKSYFAVSDRKTSYKNNSKVIPVKVLSGGGVGDHVLYTLRGD